MNIFEILNLRYEFEEIVKTYRIPKARKSGNLSNLVWFLRNSGNKNRGHDKFLRAREIADIILQVSNHAKQNQFGVRRGP